MARRWVQCTYCGLKALRVYIDQGDPCKHCNQKVRFLREEERTTGSNPYGYPPDPPKRWWGPGDPEWPQD